MAHVVVVVGPPSPTFPLGVRTPLISLDGEHISWVGRERGEFLIKRGLAKLAQLPEGPFAGRPCLRLLTDELDVYGNWRNDETRPTGWSNRGQGRQGLQGGLCSPR